MDKVLSIYNEIYPLIQTQLKEENIDDIDLSRFNEHIFTEISTGVFLSEFNKVYNKDYLVNEQTDTLVLLCILIGMGRNRTLNILKDYKVKRGIFERIRDHYGLTDSEIRMANEKLVSGLKWSSKSRAARKAELANDWEEIVERYLNGESPVVLSKEYNVSRHIITQQLKDEDLYDERRSTHFKREVAERKIDKVDDGVIIELVQSNPLESKESLWRKAQEIYPWILRRQFYDKLIELNLERSEEEINEIRSIKSRVETNTDYMIKVNGYRAVKETFGSIDNLVIQHMEKPLGSYNKIADFINKSIDFEYKISSRQVEKIITGNKHYRPHQSAGETQLYNFIRSIFPEEIIEREVSFDPDTQERIDIYIPRLKVGFEYNGEYWHSDEVIQHNYNKTSEEFHSERRERVGRLKDTLLLYVWEDDWNYHYDRVERAIRQADWNNPILNKMKNVTQRSGRYSPPEKRTNLLRGQVFRFLQSRDIEYSVNEENHIVLDKIIIDIPSYRSLSNKKRSLNLQKKYEGENVEFLTFLPWMKFNKIKQFLIYRLGLKDVIRIGARKCELEITDGITGKQREFFDSNHLLGYFNFKNIDKTVTLSYEGEPVISALFVKSKDSKVAELKRLVSAYGVSVPGGASRLLSAYLRDSEVDEVFTFSDCDLGFGGVYKTLGFTQIERSREQLNWYNEALDMKISNLSLIMVGADRLLKSVPGYEPTGVGEGLPNNQEIIQSYGFIPIYDSGYKKWVIKT